MAMALAVAFVACQAATPAKPAEPEQGPQGPPGESPGHGPTTIGEVSVAVSLAASGPMASMEIDLAEHFHDPDGAEGETLTYQHTSDDAAVATSSVAGNTLTITAAAAGNATISVTAMDKDELKSPTKKFKVTVTPAVAPMVKEGGIGDQTLYLADGAMNIVLTTSEGSEEGYFTHSSDISYAVSAAPIGYVEASEANGTLTLKPLLEGTTIVTIVATADSESTAPVTFRVTVESGNKPVPPKVAPTVTENLPDIRLGTDHMSEDFDLSDHFSHPNSEITYSAQSDDKSIATASVEGDMLTVALADTGTTRVVVTAMADGLPQTDGFQVEVVNYSVRMPYSMGEIEDMTLTDGEDPADTDTRDVENNFRDPDGQDLEYRAEPEDETVATAAVAGSVVTVTAVGEGSTTIVVWAVDEDGLDSYRLDFMVTVEPAAPEEETEPDEEEDLEDDPVIIQGKDKTTPYEVGEDERIVPRNELIVTASRDTGSDTMWTLKGESKGSTTLDIVGGEDPYTVDVDVLNSIPERKTATIEGDKILVPDGYDPDAIPAGTVTALLLTDLTDTYSPDLARHYHAVSLPPRDAVKGPYFSDADGPGDFEYKGETSSPHVVVKEVLKPAGNRGPLAIIDVKKKAGASFELYIWVEDKDGEESDRLRVTVETVDPLPDSEYKIEQLNDGNFRGGSLAMYNRQGIAHTVAFKARASAPDTDSNPATLDPEGFRFANMAQEEVDKLPAAAAHSEVVGAVVVGAKTAAGAAVPTALPEAPKADTKVLDNEGNPVAATVAPTDLPLSQYSVRTTGGIVAKLVPTTPADGVLANNDEPTVNLTLRGTGGGTVTIAYHYWVDLDGDAGEVHTATWREVSRKFTVTVK